MGDRQISINALRVMHESRTTRRWRRFDAAGRPVRAPRLRQRLAIERMEDRNMLSGNGVGLDTDVFNLDSIQSPFEVIRVGDAPSQNLSLADSGQPTSGPLVGGDVAGPAPRGGSVNSSFFTIIALSDSPQFNALLSDATANTDVSSPTAEPPSENPLGSLFQGAPSVVIPGPADAAPIVLDTTASDGFVTIARNLWSNAVPSTGGSISVSPTFDSGASRYHRVDFDTGLTDWLGGNGATDNNGTVVGDGPAAGESPNSSHPRVAAPAQGHADDATDPYVDLYADGQGVQILDGAANSSWDVGSEVGENSEVSDTTLVTEGGAIAIDELVATLQSESGLVAPEELTASERDALAMAAEPIEARDSTDAVVSDEEISGEWTRAVAFETIDGGEIPVNFAAAAANADVEPGRGVLPPAEDGEVAEVRLVSYVEPAAEEVATSPSAQSPADTAPWLDIPDAARAEAFSHWDGRLAGVNRLERDNRPYSWLDAAPLLVVLGLERFVAGRQNLPEDGALVNRARPKKR